jgi:integrase
MRLGEIQALQKEDIKDNYILVTHSWDRKYGIKGTKTGKDRRIPLAEDVQKVIIDYVQFRCGYVFSKDSGRTPIRHEVVYKSFYEAAAAIGIDREQLRSRNITFHSWRHLFATRLAENNFPDVFIRELTGHSSANMQRRYTHIRPEELTLSFAV